jgi:hypothetical protein
MVERASRIRDKVCTYIGGCTALILRQSSVCRHHLGVMHGEASARTYVCSAACQLVHQRCTAPSCGRLCGGGHPAELRDGLCYAPGQINCWSTTKGRAIRWWLITCGMCSRSWTRERLPVQASRCGHCGSIMLSAEPIVGWEAPRDLLARWPQTPKRQVRWTPLPR